MDCNDKSWAYCAGLHDAAVGIARHMAQEMRGNVRGLLRLSSSDLAASDAQTPRIVGG